MAAVTECYKSKSSSATMISDPKDQAILLLVEALVAQSKPDACAQIAGMNSHEARAKIAESQNAAFGAVAGNLAKSAVAVAGIVVGGDVLKEGMANAGNKTNITGDRNVGERDMSTTESYVMPQAIGSKTTIGH